MNLFATSPSPAVSATHLCDIRLRKMILETAQLLCTELRRRGKDFVPYRSTHPQHPVTLSLRHDPTLWWTLDYFEALHAEYRHRFNKNHKSYLDCILKIRYGMPPTVDYTIDPPRFHNSARNLSRGCDYTHLPIHEAYRAYLAARWSCESPVWTNRTPPEFYRQPSPTAAPSVRRKFSA